MDRALIEEIGFGQAERSADGILGGEGGAAGTQALSRVSQQSPFQGLRLPENILLAKQSPSSSDPHPLGHKE